jgi:hypothetical protein
VRQEQFYTDYCSQDTSSYLVTSQYGGVRQGSIFLRFIAAAALLCGAALLTACGSID